MMRTLVAKSLCAVVLGIAMAGPVSAVTSLSDFSNFNLSGVYEAWGAGTFTSNATNFQVQAGDFGGGFFDLPAVVDASGESVLELLLDVNAANVAGLMNVVLIDGDGTERVYRFDGLSVGAGQTLTKPISDFLQDNQPGTVAGLDLATLTTFHIQGTFTNGNPGLAMDLTFDNIGLTVPEPAAISLACFGLIGVAAATRRRRVSK